MGGGGEGRKENDGEWWLVGEVNGGVGSRIGNGGEGKVEWRWRMNGWVEAVVGGGSGVVKKGGG